MLTLEEFLPKARALNPDYSDDEHIQAYEERYGRQAPVQTVSPAPLTTFEEFLPKARALNPDYSDEEHYAAWNEKYGARGARESDQGDFLRGAGTAFKQIPQTVRGLEAGVGAIGEKVFGEGGLFTALKDHGLKGYQEWAQDIAKESKPSDSVSEAYHMARAGDPGALVDWLQYGLGYAGGQALQMLATAGIGYVAGKMALQPAAAALAGKLIAKEKLRIAATEEGAKLAADQLAKQAVSNVAGRIGQTAALASVATGMEGGEIYGGLVEKAAQEGRSLTGEELAKATGMAVGAGWVEFIGDKFGVDLLLGKSVANRLATSRIGNALAAGTSGLAVEGLTEAIQTPMEQIGKGEDPLAPESVRETIDSAALGALGGTAVGVTGGVTHRPDTMSSSAPAVTERTPEEMGIAEPEVLTEPRQLTGPPEAGEIRSGTVYGDGPILDVSPLPDVSSVTNASTLDEAIANAVGVVQGATETAKARAAEFARMTAKARNEAERLIATAPEKRAGTDIPILPGPTTEAPSLLNQPSPIVPGTAFTPRPEPEVDPRRRLEEERARMLQQRAEQQAAMNRTLERTRMAQSGTNWADFALPRQTVQAPPVAPARTPDKPLPTSKQVATDQAYPSVDDLHALADSKGIIWDNDPQFMAFTEQTTGKKHLDELDQSERQKMAQALRAVERPTNGMQEEKNKLLAMGGRDKSSPAPPSNIEGTRGIPFQNVPRRTAQAEREVIDEAAHEAATSPKNDLPQPTEGQREAGNYQKGHIRLAGLEVSIENPAGSERSGMDATGKPWSVTMQDHYGYIRGTKGKDKDHIDIFIKPGTPDNYTGPVFVVDQKNQDGAFDEHKVVLGASSIDEARQLYQRNYSSDWDGLMSIKQFTMPEFKLWLKAGNKSKPVGDVKRESLRKEADTLKPQTEEPPTPDLVLTAPPSQTVDQKKAKSTPTAEQMSIEVPPPTVGERPIIGREITPEEAPLFSKAAQEKEAEQTTIEAAPVKQTDETPAQPEPAQSPTEILATALRQAADRIEGKKIDDVGEKIGGARKDLVGKSEPRPVKPKPEGPAWQRRYTVSQIVNSLRPSENGKWAIRDTKDTDFAGRPRQMGSLFDTEEEARAMIPVVVVAKTHRVYQNRDGKWEIFKRSGDRKLIHVVNQQFDTEEDAKRYLAQHAAEILEAKTFFGEEILPRPETVERIGTDRRNGRNVEANDFKETFGFRAVEFGNWQNQDERQEVMNHAYDGLHDLAEVLNIPPRAIGLNGDLALAFGSRGSGLSGAAAHYERNYGVINLTKMQGAGHLAHEWFHAADHYFGRQDTKASSEKEKNSRGDLVYKAKAPSDDYASYGFRRTGSQVREEVREAYTALINTMLRKGEQYVEDTQKADKFVAEARKRVADQLEAMRNSAYGLSAQLKYGKRNTAPATAEQLAEFDAIANRILEGELFPDRFVQSDLANKHKRYALSGRWTNDALEKISAIYKAVRGRSGFGSGGQTGVLDDLRTSMKFYSARLKMLADAQAGTEHTKQVPTSYAMEAKSMDQGRKEAYWATNHEMAARAFAAYVEDKLKAEGKKSDFITYQTKGAVPTIWGWKKPYPEGSERDAINAAFDKFVGTLKTKETDQGVALFSRTSRDRDMTPEEQAAFVRTAKVAYARAPNIGNTNLLFADSTDLTPPEILRDLSSDPLIQQTAMVLERATNAFQQALGIRDKATFRGFDVNMKNGGINVSGTLAGRTGEGSQIFLNPYVFAVKADGEVSAGHRTREQGVQYVANQLTQKLVHEITHQEEFGHDTHFARAFKRNYATLHSQRELLNADLIRLLEATDDTGQSLFDRLITDNARRAVAIREATSRRSRGATDHGVVGRTDRDQGDGPADMGPGPDRPGGSLPARVKNIERNQGRERYRADQLSTMGGDRATEALTDETVYPDTENPAYRPSRFGAQRADQPRGDSRRASEGASRRLRSEGPIREERHSEASEGGDEVFSPGLQRSRTLNEPYSFLRDERGSVPVTGTIDTTQARDRLQSAKPALRPYLLGALGLEQIAQVYGREHAEVHQYNQATQAMEADFVEMSRDSEKVVKSWTGLKIPVADAMAQVMEDARFLNFDPDPKKNQEADSQKKKDLRTRFEALPDDAKTTYRLARDFYTDMAEKRFQALKERIERAGGTPENTKKLVDRLQLAYEQVRSKVYFPFTRFGEHIVVAKQMKDGKEVDREVHAFESVAEAQKFASMMKLKGWQVKQTVAKEYSVDKEGPASKIVRQMSDIINELDEQPGLPGVQNLTDQLLDSLNQSFLQALPDMSYAKHFIHAKDVKGASKDALRAFAHSALHGAHHISRIRHADKMTAALLNLDERINKTSEGDVTEARQVYNELVQRHNEILNPSTHPVSAWLGQLGFTMSLGGVVATGVTNATQVPLITYPWLGARYGFGKASTALARAYRDFLDPRTLNKESLFDASKSKLISESERKMLLELARRGRIDLTQTMDLAGLSAQDNLSRVARMTGTTQQKVMRMLGFTFHAPEVMNRQVTALAAFRLEKEKGGTFEEALQRAEQAIIDTHFIYTADNRPRYMSGNVLRVLTMFRQYSQNIAFLYGRAASIWLDKNHATAEERQVAKRQLISMLALQFGAAGALGMPFFGAGIDALMSVVSAFGDDDDKRDWEVALRQWLDGQATSLAEAFISDKEKAREVGREIGEVISHGASRLTPWDMAARLGQQDLFFRSPQREREGRAAAMDWLTSLSGPVVGYAVNGYLGLSDVAKGLKEANAGFFLRGVEELTPAVLRNGVKALRYTIEDVRTRDQYKQLELNKWEELGQLFGFTPSKVAEMYESTTAVRNREHRILKEKKNLLDRFARTVTDRDMKARQRVMEDIRAFNSRNRMDTITSDTLNRSLKTRMQHEQGMERGIYLPPKRRALLEEGDWGDF